MRIRPGVHADHPKDEPERSKDAAPTMTVPAGYRPAKVAEVLELDMGDGLILYEQDSNVVHHLNSSASIVWRLCDGDTSVAELAKIIAREHGLAPADVEPQVALVVAEFAALDLVEDVGTGSRKAER